MLARIRKSAENKDSGFTLIELLVVMIIIGILAAIAIPAFLNQKKKANETAAKSDATSISKDVAAALVDGNLSAATLTQASGAIVATLSTTIVGGTAETAEVRVSKGNTVTMTIGTPGTTGTTTYCVTANPGTDNGSAWSAGPGGLKKGLTCV